MPRVRFQNECITVDVPEGARLLEVAEEHGVDVFRGMWPHLNCDGSGICGRCKVWIAGEQEAIPPRTLTERYRRVKGALRLACQVKVLGDLEVRTRPIGPDLRELAAAAGDMGPAAYTELAAQRLVEAEEEERQKEELARKKAAAAKKKKEAEEKKKAEEEKKAEKEAAAAANKKAEEEAAAVKKAEEEAAEAGAGDENAAPTEADAKPAAKVAEKKEESAKPATPPPPPKATASPKPPPPPTPDKSA